MPLPHLRRGYHENSSTSGSFLTCLWVCRQWQQAAEPLVGPPTISEREALNLFCDE